jgi:nucleoid-associated protein
MKIANLIIHNLNKEVSGNATLLLSKDVLDSSDKKTVSLIEELNSRFRNNIAYGVFTKQQDDANTFHKEFDKYLRKSSKDKFISFSNTTANLLYNKISTIPQARGGYIVYSDYNDDYGNHFFSVFLIRDKKDKQFKQRDGIITIGEVICVETDKLAMACRINLKSYQEYTPDSLGTYLGFVSIKQPETSDYFLNWIGAEKKQRDTEDTRSLVKIITNISVPNEEGKPMQREAFKRKAYDVIRSFNKSPVNISAMSLSLFNNEATIGKYAEEHGIILSTEFYADNKTLKNLTEYHVKEDNIDLKFPTEYFGDKIRVDHNNPDLVIIESAKFAKAIAEEDKLWKI